MEKMFYGRTRLVLCSVVRQMYFPTDQVKAVGVLAMSLNPGQDRSQTTTG